MEFGCEGPLPSPRAGRGSTRRALVVALLAALVGCSPQPVGPEGRDLRLLEHMIRLNALHFGIAPHVRQEQHYPEIARVAEEIERLGEDPVFAAWPYQPGYRHPPELFERYRSDLLEGARGVRAAAEAGDKDGLHAAFAALDASCTVCHKRFSPTY